MNGLPPDSEDTGKIKIIFEDTNQDLQLRRVLIKSFRRLDEMLTIQAEDCFANSSLPCC
jgi:hypothetical protein